MAVRLVAIVSVRVISKVFRESKSTGAARLVLIALADVAADSGEVTAYARSYSVLAAKANCGEGTVRKAIRQLEELGEVEVLVRGDGRTKSDYRIHLPTLGSDLEPQKRTQGAPDAHPITPSLLVDPSLSENSRASLVAAFEAWWLTYPARDGKTRGDKGKARAAWERLTEGDRERVVIATPNYAAATDAQYVMDGVRFVTSRRFDDWQTPGKRRAKLGAPVTGLLSEGPVRQGVWSDD